MKASELEPTLEREIESFSFLKDNYVFTSSTLTFQNQSGIKVCQYYKMPGNLPVEKVYKYYSSVLDALDRRKIKRAEADKRIALIYNSIEKLNPELSTIGKNFQNTNGHVLIAVLSLFNIDDIRAYVEEGKTGRYYIEHPGWKVRYAKINEIEELTNAKITWIMCDKTLNRVYDEACKKYKKISEPRKPVQTPKLKTTPKKAEIKPSPGEEDNFDSNLKG